jgi:hypothetical protein
MLTTNQLADQIEQYRRGSLSLLAFEDWFSDQSWNIHQSNRQHDIDAVFAIEDILSRRHSDGLDEETLKQELANAVRPFVSLVYMKAEDQIEIELPSEKASLEVEVELRPSTRKAAASAPRYLYAQVG